MKAPSLHRLFLVVAVGCATVWVWAALMLWSQERADADFNRRVIQPEVERARKIAAAHQPDNTPLAPYEPFNLAAFNESLERMRVRDHYWSIRENAMIGLFVTGFCWMITAQIQLWLRRRAREALARPASPNAGHLVGDLVQQGRSFLARSKPDGSGIEVEVDGRRALVIFRNLTFVTAFAGNKRQSVVELPFSDLLVLTTGYNKGTGYLNLRTTAGTVFWTDKVRPFDTLAALLDDIIERNRADPAAYRAARAREPVVRTPWWGWALLLGCVAGVAALAWYFLSHPI